MRVIEKEKFFSEVKNLLIQTHYYLPEDVLEAIKNAISLENNEVAKDVLKKILDNATVASKTKLPLCQDTGIPQFFINIGNKVMLNFSVEQTINEIVQEVYETEKFRKSSVEDPILRSFVKHYSTVYLENNLGDTSEVEISVLIRGGGTENTVFNTTLLPTVELKEIIDTVYNAGVKLLPYSCPPAVVGVGLGGTVEQSIIIAKKSLLRKINQRNKNVFYSEMEIQLKQKFNFSNIGPLGLGGKTTVLDVFIETLPVHIACLPVSVVLQCHSFRRNTIRI